MSGERQTRSGLRVALFFLLHGTSSVFLVLCNKQIMLQFPNPWVVLFVQNIGTLLITGVLHWGQWHPHFTLKPFRRRHLKTALLMAVWFIVTLGSSFKALYLVSIPLYVIGRSLTPLATAVLECVFRGTVLTARSICALVMVIAGSTFYTLHDASAEFVGVAYSLSNVALVAGLCVYEKSQITALKAEQTPVGLNLYRVILSMPLLLLLIFYEGFPTVDDVSGDLHWLLVWLIVSSLFGFGIGVFLFCLQQEVEATSIQLANMGYKCATTLVSGLTHPAEVRLVGWIGYAITLAGLSLYTFTPKKKQKV